MEGWRLWRPVDQVRLDDHVELVDMPIPTLRAIYATDGDDWVILVNRRLSPVDRIAAVAHELVHRERGGGCRHEGMPSSWSPIVKREEATVDRIVARRLVPRGPLVEFVDGMLAMDLGVAASDVAEHFEVAYDVAQRALDDLHPGEERWSA